jgi:hypothetical protein
VFAPAPAIKLRLVPAFQSARDARSTAVRRRETRLWTAQLIGRLLEPLPIDRVKGVAPARPPVDVGVNHHRIYLAIVSPLTTDAGKGSAMCLRSSLD